MPQWLDQPDRARKYEEGRREANPLKRTTQEGSCGAYARSTNGKRYFFGGRPYEKVTGSVRNIVRIRHVRISFRCHRRTLRSKVEAIAEFGIVFVERILCGGGVSSICSPPGRLVALDFDDGGLSSSSGTRLPRGSASAAAQSFVTRPPEWAIFDIIPYEFGDEDASPRGAFGGRRPRRGEGASPSPEGSSDGTSRSLGPGPSD